MRLSKVSSFTLFPELVKLGMHHLVPSGKGLIGSRPPSNVYALALVMILGQHGQNVSISGPDIILGMQVCQGSKYL